MKTASLNLRYSLTERVQAFERGLKRHGFETRPGLQPADLLITWNRIGSVDHIANSYATVLVTENAAWGNGFLGRSWVSLARDRHNTAGMFPVGDDARWDRLGVELSPWRREGETVILPQRGIGSPPTAMPRGWPQDAYRRHGGRIRPHPGTKPCKPLKSDLDNAGRVVTWGSGAAIQALMMGIPVISEMPSWIGGQDNTNEGRLAMFRGLAWAQWTLDEIQDGSAFARLIDGGV